MEWLGTGILAFAAIVFLSGVLRSAPAGSAWHEGFDPSPTAWTRQTTAGRVVGALFLVAAILDAVANVI